MKPYEFQCEQPGDFRVYEYSDGFYVEEFVRTPSPGRLGRCEWETRAGPFLTLEHAGSAKYVFEHR